MAVKIIVPKLGMSAKPLALIEWKVREGEQIEKGATVLVVETEKIRHDIEAETSGFLHILLKAGNEAPIGSVAGIIAETKEELEALKKEIPEEIAVGATEPAKPPKVEAEVAATAKPEEKHLRISPVARKLAEEHMVDISKIVGTGPQGRIVKEDIEKEIESKKKVVEPEVYQGKRVKSTIPLTGMKKTVAEHMHGSLQVSAQLTVMGEIDMSEMVQLREKLAEQAEVLGTKITYTDLMVLITAKVLKDYPLVNSSIVDNEINLWEDINIGVAVALEEGLIVPVIKNADHKSLVEISKAVKELAKKARDRTLEPEDVQGGTFTLTNLGALGSGYRFETVIINQPESAILGTGGISDRVLARDGQVVIKPVMTYYFTYDHRVINGAVAAKFITSLTELIENPSILLAKTEYSS